MSNCFVYTDKPVAENCSITWANQVALSTPFNDDGDCCINDSINESYATAIDVNETQYLSVLETTNDVTLEDLQNLTIGNPKLMEQENSQSDPSAPGDEDMTSINSNDQQIVIFNMEGSEDLYGIQITQDEEGNMQKYQFQVRTNGNGQYEAIPETIQLLSSEENQCSEDLQEDISKQTYESVVDNDKTLEEVVYETQVYINDQSDEEADSQIYLQNENVIEEIHTEENNHIHDSETVYVYLKSEATTEGENYTNVEKDIKLEETNFCADNDGNVEVDDTIDIKPGLIETPLTCNIKQDYDNIQSQLSQEIESHNQIIYETDVSSEEPSQEILSQGYHSGDIYNEDVPDEGTILEYEQFDSQNIEEICDDTTVHSTEEEPNQQHTALFIEEGKSSPGEGINEEQGITDNESDTDSYQIDDGLHVTAEGDISRDSSTDYQTLETIYQNEEQLDLEQTNLSEKGIICSTNILKQPTNVSSVDNFSNKTILYYMITNADQKENAISMPLNNGLLSVKPNPRSLLKSKVETVVDLKCYDSHLETVSVAPIMPKEKSKDLKKSPSRRFARSSETAQAKLFNNFINKTTIAQAPVRQVRLPRKQEIKPVDTRQDEEIIVKEVMVSSKGFVENINDRFNSKDKLEVTSIVELTDSEEENDSLHSSKKKKKPHKSLDGTVIEILQSDEEPEEVTKRGRGRPRKSNAVVVVDGSKRPRGRPPKASMTSPQKKTRNETSEQEVVQGKGKTEFKCPHCSKSFPSSNSLSTHIQHHNLENSLKNAKTQPIEFKHKCDNCHAIFKNNILLKRHLCQKKNPKSKCTVCSKTFDSIAALDLHKRGHLKENLVKNTTTVTVSPKKFIRSRPSSVDKFKSPKQVGTFKCKHCPKVCSSPGALSTHERIHKSFTCTTCKSSFPSKLLLDTHLRISCVKSNSPKDKRLSFKIRKSFVNSPKRKIPLKSTGRTSVIGSRNGSRLSVLPKKVSMLSSRTSTIPSKTATIPSRTSTIPCRTSTIPSGTATIPNKTSTIPSGTATISSRTATLPNTTHSLTSRTLVVPSRTALLRNENTLVLNKSIVSSIASVVSSSSSGVLDRSTITVNKTSGVHAKPIVQCSLCQMKFNTMSDLFKHEVRDHNVSTPDKKVLLPEKKMLHSLNEHGGVPIPGRLNNCFQSVLFDESVMKNFDEK